MSRANALVAGAGHRWTALGEHPFVRATAAGTLPEASWHRWLLEDHAFVVEFRRFLAGVLLLAPDEASRDALAGGVTALTPELELFRSELVARGLSAADHQPSVVCLGYAGWVLASLHSGYDVALAVLHAVERAYLDAWTAVRERAVGQRYEEFVRNWSSPAFAAWVQTLAELLGAGTPTPAQQLAYRRVAEWEHAFWDAVDVG